MSDATEHLRQEESCKVSSDLEAELELLRTTLEMKGAELHDVIKGESQRKEAELQVRKHFYICPFSIFEFWLFLLKTSYITLYCIILYHYILQNLKSISV